MNPFKVYNVIKKAESQGERMNVDTLSQRCGERIRHKYLIMSEELFQSENSGGFPRHWVKGLQPHSWITLWFYRAPEPISPPNPDDLEEAQDISELFK